MPGPGAEIPPQAVSTVVRTGVSVRTTVILGVTLAFLLGLGAYGFGFLPKANVEEGSVPSNMQSLSCADACDKQQQDCVLNVTARQGDPAECIKQAAVCKNHCQASAAAASIETQPPAPPAATSTDTLVPDPKCLGDCDAAYQSCKSDETMPLDSCVSSYNACIAQCKSVEPIPEASTSTSATSTINY